MVRCFSVTSERLFNVLIDCDYLFAILLRLYCIIGLFSLFNNFKTSPCVKPRSLSIIAKSTRLATDKDAIKDSAQ